MEWQRAWKRQRSEEADLDNSLQCIDWADGDLEG